MEPGRRVVAGLTTAAVALVAIGIAALVFDAGLPGPGGTASQATRTVPAHSGTPTASRSVAPSSPLPSGGGASASASPEISASPDASAVPSPRSSVFVAYGDGFAYVAEDGTQVPVPPVPGLEVLIQNGQANYFALASNRYGLKAGTSAGEFMPLVTMGQPDGSSAQTGGVVLIGAVASRLISDRLAATQADSDRWVVALPVDIRKAAGTNVSVAFDKFGLAGWSNTPRVIVRFTGSLRVTEAVPSNGGFHVLVEQLGLTRWQVIDPIRLKLPTDSIDPTHAMNELLVYGNGTPSATTDQFFDHSAAMGSLLLAATDDVSVSLVVNGSHADLGPDKVLTVGDVPVFVASN
jgi:hypothetical protein